MPRFRATSVALAISAALALQATTTSAAYVNSLTGPVTASELQATANWFKANPYTPTGTNQGNNFAYGNGAKQAGTMENLYEMTGDIYFLDQAIRFSDHILSVRNSATSGRMIWTGRREPCWPNKAADAGDAAYCGTENGYVIAHMVASARLIAKNPAIWNQTVGIGDPHGYGATYIARARKFLTEGKAVYDDFLIRYFVEAGTNRLRLPTHAGWAAMPGNYAKDQGNNVPWNQQDMVTSGLANIADMLMALNEDSARVTRYDAITRAALTAFTSELEQFKYTKNGVTVYLWGYPPGGALKYPEDLAHASADINMLYSGYRRGRFGVARTYLVGIGNTFMEVIRLADGTFAGKVNGGGTPRASVSSSWSKYNEFRSGIYPVQFQQDELDAAQTNAESAFGILGIRKALYGQSTPTPTPTARPTPTATPTTPPTGSTKYEAESLTITASSGDPSTVNTGEGGSSGGAYVMYSSNAVGDFLRFRVPNVAPGSYSVTLGYKRYTNRGTAQVVVGAEGGSLGNLGAPVNMAGSSAFLSVNLGTWTIGTTGNKSVELRLTTAGTMAVDYITLTRQ